MSSSVQVYSPLKRLEWERGLTKRLVKDTLFGQLSNRVEVTSEMSNEGDPTVPDAVVNTMKSSPKMGSYSTTMPMLDKLRDKGQGGFQSVKGKEERPTMLWKTVYYNVKRKGITIDDQSVEGDLTSAYPIMEQKNALLQDYFVELNDYDKQHSLVWGADEFLTESEYWTGTTLSSAPLAKALNTNLLYAGQTAAITWNSTMATHLASLRTALNAWTDATVTFDKAYLDKAISWANRNLVPLNWKGGGGRVKFVFVLTQYQADQLVNDADTTGWIAIMKDAGARGAENRAITGLLGIYRETMLVVGTRDVVLDCNTGVAAASAFGFVTPWDENGTVDRKVKGNVSTPANAGTCEVGLLLGKNAIGNPTIKEIAFHAEEDDYGFVKGFEARKADGNVRMEWHVSGDADKALVTQPVNQGSALYFTPTPSLML